MHIHRVVGTAVLLIGISHASGDTEKASTALVISGNAAAHSREVAASAIETIARDTGVPLTNASFTAKETSTIRGCVTAPRAWNCVAPVVQTKGLQQLVVISLTNDTSTDGSPMVVVTGQVIAAHMDAAVSDQRFCVRCTDDVLVNVTSELMHSLFHESETRAGRTVVRIKSTPRGARIVFDGHSMGATDRSFNTFQGKHTVALELDGYRRESRTIEATLDRTSELSVTMRPITMSVTNHQDAERCEGSPPGAPLSGTLAPKLVMATGGLAVVAGIIVIALDQDSTHNTGPMEPSRYYYDTMAPGIGLVASGIVVGVGGYLWWHYTKSTAMPMISSIAGGASIGIVKSF